jgi:hypothetical protein
MNQGHNYDSEENLRIENEILKLKIQAEHGTIIGGSEDIPAKIENEFLNQVQQFEEVWEDVKYIKVYDLLGRPNYKTIQDLQSNQVGKELDRLLILMTRKGICLDVLGEYETELIYRFVTEELFKHETTDMRLPGMITHFIYEEFHPNHPMDIEKTAREFIRSWFSQGFNEYYFDFATEMVIESGQLFTRQQAKDIVNACLNSYSSFSNEAWTINEIKFQWDHSENKGLGHAEGTIRYDAVLEEGEILHFEGPFKFYLSNESGYWQIYYFVFPGFRWQD